MIICGGKKPSSLNFRYKCGNKSVKLISTTAKNNFGTALIYFTLALPKCYFHHVTAILYTTTFRSHELRANLILDSKSSKSESESESNESP